MKQSIKDYKRIIIKVGSSLLCSRNNKLDYKVFGDVSRQVAELVKGGREVVVVSSGAIALGMHVLGLKERPKQLHNLQAAAAVGQHVLMNTYRKFFRGAFHQKELHCAQVLLTWEDFDDRKRYLNAKNTLLALLGYRTIPIINENDTVSTEEIRFGDNDRLSALVASLISADLLIILSDVSGLMDKDKKTVIKLVDKITPQIRELACPTDKKTCVGGMVTKLEAAKIAIDSGIPCVIANGRKKDIILSAIKNPQGAGTLFFPRKDYFASKERWIAFSAKPKGRIIVDDGARQALINKKSLLSVGIVGLEGNFSVGDIVSVRDRLNFEFARGKARISSKELENIKGKRFEKEVIHRDDIVIL